MPRGQIIGVALFSEPFFYERKFKTIDLNIVGPICYPIVNFAAFKQTKPHVGNTGLTYLKDENWLNDNEIYKSAIQDWKEQHEDEVFVKGKKGFAILTIKQPFAAFIKIGVKKCENRNTFIFSIHEDKNKYCHPAKPANMICRFCPVDGRCSNDKHGDIKRYKKNVVSSHDWFCYDKCSLF